ncbi:MAG: hypothetical protein ACRCYT_06515 [Cetobacterium sp.]|uniref:hypothetical protein n=1 Tax=Cetobacterium sp. TaxID=2071632 RepID=UPI003F2CA7D5
MHNNPQHKYKYQEKNTEQMPSQTTKEDNIFIKKLFEVIFLIILFGFVGYLASWLMIPFFWILFDTSIETCRIIMSVGFAFIGLLDGLFEEEKYGVRGYFRTSKYGNVHLVSGHTRRR